MDRRTFLSTAIGLGLAGALAGCATGDDSSPTSIETPDELYALTGSYSIQPGNFRDLALDVDEPATIDYTVDVRSGPNIDVLLLARGEFREYQRGNEFETIEDATAFDTSYADVRADIGPTDVNIVFDNTNAGEATPPDSNGVATLYFELTVTRRDD